MFTDHLKTMGIKKYELADLMGCHSATISRWGEHPPKYVWTYLHERQKVRECDQRVVAALCRIEDLVSEMKLAEMSGITGKRY